MKGKKAHSKVYNNGLIKNTNSLNKDFKELFKLPLWLFGFLY